MFGFFRKKKPATESSQAALHAASPAGFREAGRRRVTPDVLKQLRAAALAAIDERLAEGESEESEQQKLYRRFLMTAACTEAFAFELRTSEDAVVPVGDWTNRTTGAAQEAAFALMELHDAGASLREGETLIVPDVMLAGLRLPQPEVLGLPPSGGESVLLAPRGFPYSESFDVEMDFMSDMRRIIRPKRSGMVLESGGRRRLLTPEIFIIAETVDGFKHDKAAAEDEEGCRFAWAKAVGVLGASPAAQRALSSRLHARILTAERISVEMDARGRLRPVMLAPRNLRETVADFTSLLGAKEKEGTPLKHRSLALSGAGRLRAPTTATGAPHALLRMPLGRSL